ncbi:hypothetical protein [Mesorhizobium sp. M8A.F.Ca.ET.207.01.1.1]|uniref:hypothetical protein n=1 Tax=Mesorhizobium sp. M8A.F.Ca.ET.207.01.1.1 TaxID=2563968 RepID=UPI0016786B99|nr:hypothetical protein [Mesorhizobium sp. M8A.F.Ca.ET.207.01.1.1]
MAKAASPLNAIPFLELTEHHFERCLKSTLIEHHRFLRLVKVAPVGEGILVLMQNVTNTVVDLETMGMIPGH